jgi:hypothetical protein
LLNTTKADKDLKSKLENLSGTYADPKPYNYEKAWGSRILPLTKANGR